MNKRLIFLFTALLIFSVAERGAANPARFQTSGKLTIPAIQVGTDCSRVIFNLYDNSADKDNFYFSLDLAAIETSAYCGDGSATVSLSDLKISIPFLESQGSFLQLALDYQAALSTASTLIWKVELTTVTQASTPFNISTSTFSYGDTVPVGYTGDGTNISPPLAWSSPPSGTQSYTLIMDDPDAPGGTWDHWIVYDIPASTTTLSENAGAQGGAGLPAGSQHGMNSNSKDNYQGPGPPKGTGVHRYFFKLFALSVDQLNPAGTSRAEIEAAMSGKILGYTEFMGTYTRDN